MYVFPQEDCFIEERHCNWSYASGNQFLVLGAFYILIAVYIETNGLTRLRARTRGYFFRDFMNVGLPREIFINDKPERFALIALVYWDAVYMNIHCVVI